MDTRTVDVAIIGSGTAGLNARREVEKAGGQPLLIESGPYGTTCARVGCMPSKLLIAAADAAHEVAGARRFGIRVPDGVEVDDTVKRLFPNHGEHDPSDLAAARALAEDPDVLPLGILYHNPDAPRYDTISAVGLEMSIDEKLAGLNTALDHFAI